MWDSLFRKNRQVPSKAHEFKWAAPEQRLTAPIDDAEKTIAALRREKAAFVSGGEFIDVIHAKEYGQGVFAYFIVRTEKKTQKESVLFDGYMIQENDRLGEEVVSSSTLMRDLEELGYRQSLAREVTEWRFTIGVLRAAVFEIEGFGKFLEVALPEAKTDKIRETQEAASKSLFKKLGLKQEDAVPTDAITLQLVTLLQQAEQAEAQPRQKRAPGEFKLGKG